MSVRAKVNEYRVRVTRGSQKTTVTLKTVTTPSTDEGAEMENRFEEGCGNDSVITEHTELKPAFKER